MESRDDVVKTYRYLRLGMVLMILFLAAAVVIAWAKVDFACLQTSVSAYYYTPAQGVLVGSLVAIGVGMVVLKGDSDLEDVLLNIAGMMAPVVALVPTPHPGRCASVVVDDAQRRASVENNGWSLILVGAVGLAVTALVLRRDRARGDDNRQHVLGLAVATALYAGGAVAFWAWRSGILRFGHYAAAIVMFACLIGVVWGNARRSAGSSSMRDAARTWYGAIAGLMLVSLLVWAVLALAGVDHALLVLEILLIGLFAWFWAIQTRERWHGTGLDGP
ncbi:FtsH-binding integral membrane protein [Nocardioides ginsengisegetis]|uniref:FtsH-binding integral membrane protein n=1 Tax=Nocardioides ginsengisegetis TaxID=661491 RepID=A0A7W3PA39_9ACTN|nr:hypothetical protein [Nocardioides ginsengisegetis]MBA8804345.1 FtsH-binding integral membrane protein [Nocardioides ginsengisegetis]